MLSRGPPGSDFWLRVIIPSDVLGQLMIIMNIFIHSDSYISFWWNHIFTSNDKLIMYKVILDWDYPWNNDYHPVTLADWYLILSETVAIYSKLMNSGIEHFIKFSVERSIFLCVSNFHSDSNDLDVKSSKHQLFGSVMLWTIQL